MKTASIRDLRTHFPKVRRLLEAEGEIVVTDRGRPFLVLRPYEAKTAQPATSIDYYARLRRRMPKALTSAQGALLDEANRGER
jgi:antitoxin (DNA-binding transcriptional repressor) of toxin-antitoxin stability system